MNPVIIIICVVVVSFVVFLLTYYGEVRVIKKEEMVKNSYVDDPSILFSTDEDDNDIEII